ncbi:Uroporphyrinogen III synthase [Flavobacterium sp. 9AF]|uniref:uroporphyrinogen-III synthase n=1 Tax=Flavobacterium sp. 9AF TaxID=2653142 RepID=UPI0012F110FC|nr:uroporphyrinogen-III synthase [Flavobacterium sp. 9AF]VXC08713.1 Uroporphyrinogen III synthase [Flavobacterium sp. 9AF]
MIVLSTKKLTEQQINLFDKEKFSLIHTNFIKIKRINFIVNNINEYLIFTSKNAVKSVLKNINIKLIKEKDCFCVGEKTKKFLEKKGFNVIIHQKDANTLAEVICKEYFQKSFTFFSGSLRKDILPRKLEDNKIQLDEISVYQTFFKSKIINSKTNAILFFSPSAVQSYLQKNSITNQVCFCIGHTTAQALETDSSLKEKNKIIVASEPTVENVIEEVIKYYT